MKTERREAKQKVNAAAKDCAKVQASWTAAFEALGGAVGTNGYGIFRERHEFKDKLQAARQHINAGLETLDQINWPTNAEYDQI